jgi:hypothetical protein
VRLGIRQMKRILLLAWVLTLALPADLLVEQEMRLQPGEFMRMLPNEGRSADELGKPKMLQTYVQGRKLVQDFGDFAYVIDLAAKRVMLVNHREKLVASTTLSAFQKMTMAAGDAENVKELLGQIPFEISMQALDTKDAPKEVAGLRAEPRAWQMNFGAKKVKATEGAENPLENAMAGAEMRMRVWLAKDFPGGADLETLKQSGSIAAASRLVNPQQKGNGLSFNEPLDRLLGELNQMKGYPVETNMELYMPALMRAMGVMMMRKEGAEKALQGPMFTLQFVVKRVSTDKIAAAKFQAPAGYRRTTIENVGKPKV